MSLLPVGLGFYFAFASLGIILQWPEWPFPGATSIRAGPGAWKSHRVPSQFFGKRDSKTFPLLSMVVN